MINRSGCPVNSRTFVAFQNMEVTLKDGKLDGKVRKIFQKMHRKSELFGFLFFLQQAKFS